MWNREQGTRIIKKIYFLILLRFILIGYCVIAIVIQGEWNIRISLQRPIWILISFISILNLSYLFLTPFLYKFFLRYIIFQILADFFAETLLIYLTGGIFSVFTSLYFVTIIVCAIFISPGASIISASICTITISGIAFLYFLSSLNNIPIPFIEQEANFFIGQEDLPFCKAYLFVQSVAFYLVAFLAGRLTLIIFEERILQEEILQHLADGVVVVDSNQHLVYINDGAKNILGLDRESIEGDLITHIFDLENHKDILKVLRMQKSFSFETEVKNNGQKIPVHLTSSTILSVYNKVRAIILILRDITQEKLMEETIQRVRRLKIMSEMGATIAHEIRNPLASIRGSVQELKGVLPPEDPRSILMDIAIRESDRVNRIITDFLAFSRVRPAIFQKTDIGVLLTEVIVFLRKRQEMPPPDSISVQVEKDLVIFADPGHLKQIFYNLGINAIEASEKIEIAVIAEQKTRGEFQENSKIHNALEMGVSISFQDKGKGIAPEYIEKIFAPFFTQKPQGTGMGLPLVSQLVELHHGICRVTSEVGKGSNFRIWLPNNENNEESQNCLKTIS